MNWNVNEVITAAKSLDITLTNADWDTEICKCWADRVMDAANAFKRNDMMRCQEMIDDANSYAI